MSAKSTRPYGIAKELAFYGHIYSLPGIIHYRVYWNLRNFTK
ncbi:hypothetical protein EI77_02515 [Prosthecobacter fusiformis]|uniref:Uncharacterized protein n=1 Tax=Prosthecobacter fusiformis TaxID=48464 RepID=A0A4R7RZT2_9BACT|nr:hypothetical protein EI77_02515 [Prosthecobacter fusiformis]